MVIIIYNPEAITRSVFYKNLVLKSLAKFTVGHMSESHFNKVSGLQPAT